MSIPRAGLHTAPEEFARAVRAKCPRLIEVGMPRPKLALSFGGSGWLFTYGLGVAQYLSEECKSLLNESYFVGSGTGVIPATALALGLTDMAAVKNLLVTKENLFNVLSSEAAQKRDDLVDLCADTFLPEDAEKLVNGKVTLAVGMGQSDRGFKMQLPDDMIYGHHISSFDNNEDLINCMKAAMVCDKSNLATFRYAEKKVGRATTVSHCSQVDQAIRHVFIKGLSGNPTQRRSQRHCHIFGVHGTLVNTHLPWTKQFQFGCAPRVLGYEKAAMEALDESFENGYHDARRYERWLEDSYHFAQADRTVDTQGDIKNLKQVLWSSYKRQSTSDRSSASQAGVYGKKNSSRKGGRRDEDKNQAKQQPL